MATTTCSATIELLLTPGHTPGHQSVRIGDLVLGADVAHFASGLDDHRFPVFGDDHDAQGRSADRLRGLRDAGLTVLPGHDPDVLRPGPVTAWRRNLPASRGLELGRRFRTDAALAPPVVVGSESEGPASRHARSGRRLSHKPLRILVVQSAMGQLL